MNNMQLLHSIGRWTGLVGFIAALIGAGFACTQDPMTQQMVWVDRGGNVLEKIGDPQVIITGTILSPDQKVVALRGRNIADGNDDIWVYMLENNGRKMQKTFHSSNERQPAWAPDGKSLIYFSYRNGPANMYKITENGKEEEFLIQPHETYAPSWSSDGKYIVYHLHNQEDKEHDNRDLWYINPEERKPMQFTDTPAFKEAMPQFSPNGKYVAYVADETGTWEAYVKAFPDGDETFKISSNGGAYPRWSGTGDEIFFWEGNALMAASVNTEGDFSMETPQKLFTGEQVGMGPRPVGGFNTIYEVAPDGQRFIVVQNSLQPRQ